MRAAGRLNRAAVLGLMLVALPLLGGSAYTACRSLWFQLAAARSVGTVAATAADGSLAVEYLTREEVLLTAETGGSDFYRHYTPGDKLTVFYDPGNPADARVDLWLEHWIVPLLLGIIGGLVLLPMILVGMHMR